MQLSSATYLSPTTTDSLASNDVDDHHVFLKNGCVLSMYPGSMHILACSIPVYPKAPGDDTDASLCLPVFQNFSDISHRESPSCHKPKLLIRNAEPMMICLSVPLHPGV
jgi:hypothetical protein